MLLLWPAPAGWEWFTVRGACAVPVHFSVGGYTPRRFPRLPTLSPGKMPRPSHNTLILIIIYIFTIYASRIILLYCIILLYTTPSGARARTLTYLTRSVFRGGHNIFTIPTPPPPPPPDEPAERRKRVPGLGAVHERTHSRAHAAHEDLTRAP